MHGLWLYLYFPHLQLDALLAQPEANPEQPTVILDSKQHQVIQVSDAALTSGIQFGMSLGSAAALSRDLCVIPYDPEIEYRHLIDIAERLYLITADICLCKPNSLLLRVHNMLHLYQDLETYWQAIKQALNEYAFSYQFATASSPLGAKLLARNQLNKITDNRQYLRQAIEQSSLVHTELSAKVQEKLNRVGIQTLGDLLKIPLAEIAKRFDLELVNYLGRLSGDFKHPIEFFHPESHFERYIELFYDIQNSQTLLKPLGYLLKRLENYLLIRDQITFNLLITLYQRDCDVLDFQIGAQQGEYRANKWQALLSLKLESIRLQGPVYGIRLKVEHSQINQPDAPDLFSAKQNALSRMQLSALLQAKLGDNTLHSVAVCDDYRPQITAAYQSPFSFIGTTTLMQANRPVLLLEKAQPLQEKVSVLHGPERIQTGWWDNQSIQRDYFIARSEQGAWYWVFRTPAMKWFLHGMFS